MSKSGDGRERLGSGPYGYDHPLIGKPCLCDLLGEARLVIPYGSYTVDGETKLVVVFYAENDPCDGFEKKVKALSGIDPERLYILDPSDRHARKAFHFILNWLSWATFRPREEAPATAKSGVMEIIAL